VILIKNIYTLWGRKRFLLPVTYFLTNLVYLFTLRVTGMTRKNTMEEDRDMQPEKRDCNASPTLYLNICLCGRQTDLSVVDVRVGVQTLFGSIDRY